MIGVIDYQAGNTRSVLNALNRIQIESLLSQRPEELDRCDGVILPGVGSARAAMQALDQAGLSVWIKTSQKPFLGICLGMQLLFEFSAEGETRTLGLLSGRVRPLQEIYREHSEESPRIPHMGWNMVSGARDSALFREITDGSYFYFAHSYAASASAGVSISATSDVAKHATSGSPLRAITDGFVSAVESGNYFGVQFHPEKSGPAGLKLLKNFEAICRSSRR